MRERPTASLLASLVRASHEKERVFLDSKVNRALEENHAEKGQYQLE